MKRTPEQLSQLRYRIESIISDIRYDALPNPGAEKNQWLTDLYEVTQIIEAAKDLYDA